MWPTSQNNCPPLSYMFVLSLIFFWWKPAQLFKCCLLSCYDILDLFNPPPHVSSISPKLLLSKNFITCLYNTILKSFPQIRCGRCLLVLIFFFQILLFFGYHSTSKSSFVCSVAFSQPFLEPFYSDLQRPACAEVPMESLSHPLYTFCIFLPQAQNQFLFHIHRHNK